MEVLQKLGIDPQQAKALQGEVQKMMEDPVKRKAMEALQHQLQGSMAKLQLDPEMKHFFEDVRKNGMDAMQKYEKDERILKKFTEATAGFEELTSAMGASLPGVPPRGEPTSGADASAVTSWHPGDMVIIHGLQARPELNDEKAMVVPPTAEERESIQGTGRVVVRLLASGEQFAIKSSNLCAAGVTWTS